MQDLLRDAAQKQALYFPPPVTAHHNEVSGPILRHLNDLRSGFARLKELGNMGASYTLPKCRKKMFRRSFRHLHQPLRRYTPRPTRADRRVKYVNETNFGLKRLCKLDTDVSGMLSKLAIVYRDEDLFKTHFALLDILEVRCVCNRERINGPHP